MMKDPSASRISTAFTIRWMRRRPGCGWRPFAPPGSRGPRGATASPGWATGEWLKRPPADAPMALWIRAKLLLRAGKLAEAEPLLARVRAVLPASPPEDHIFWNPYDQDVRLAFRPQAAGELGAVRLARGDYEAALDDLLRGGWWETPPTWPSGCSPSTSSAPTSTRPGPPSSPPRIPRIPATTMSGAISGISCTRASRR